MPDSYIGGWSFIAFAAPRCRQSFLVALICFEVFSVRVISNICHLAGVLIVSLIKFPGNVSCLVEEYAHKSENASSLDAVHESNTCFES